MSRFDRRDKFVSIDKVLTENGDQLWVNVVREFLTSDLSKLVSHTWKLGTKSKIHQIEASPFYSPGFTLDLYLPLRLLSRWHNPNSQVCMCDVETCKPNVVNKHLLSVSALLGLRHTSPTVPLPINFQHWVSDCFTLSGTLWLLIHCVNLKYYKVGNEERSCKGLRGWQRKRRIRGIVMNTKRAGGRGKNERNHKRRGDDGEENYNSERQRAKIWGEE